MRLAATIGGLATSALVLACTVLVARGPEPGGIDDVWLLFGAPDRGTVDLPAVTRRFGDALACPPGHCRAVSDVVPPVLPVSGERLRAIVARVAAEEPRTELVFQARWADEDRYVARSEWLRLPDTVAVAILGAGEDRSTLALYARPQFSLTDFGGNRARLRRWLARIEGLAHAEATR